MLFLFILGIGFAALALYVVLILTQVPGAKEQRFGSWEPLPDDLDAWKVERLPDEQGSAPGMIREVRHFHDVHRGWFGRARLLMQVRYRNRVTGGIERVEPDKVIKRRRRTV